MGRAGQPRRGLGSPGNATLVSGKAATCLHGGEEPSQGRKLHLSSLLALSLGFLTCRVEGRKGTLSKLHHQNPTKDTDFKSCKKDL